MAGACLLLDARISVFSGTYRATQRSSWLELIERAHVRQTWNVLGAAFWEFSGTNSTRQKRVFLERRVGVFARALAPQKQKNMTENPNYPWCFFERCVAPSPLYYPTEEAAVAHKVRPSNKQFFDNRSKYNGVGTNEWVLQLAVCLRKDRAAGSGERTNYPFIVLKSGHLQFDGKVFSGLVNIVWYLISTENINLDVRVSIAVAPKDGLFTIVHFFTHETKDKVYCAFRHVAKDVALVPNSQPEELSDDSTFDRDAIPEHLLATFRPAADALADLSHLRLSSSEAGAEARPDETPVLNEQSRPRVEPGPVVEPAIDLQSLLKRRTAETQRKLAEEDAKYESRRAELQKQMDALEREHAAKRVCLRNEIKAAADAMRDEIERQWIELAKTLQ